ncbi:MAG: hypothetical protein GC192_09255 [Bacteroidetes bacterium]|nr:hypothetical protein [Bacteroidota bacterium]
MRQYLLSLLFLVVLNSNIFATVIYVNTNVQGGSNDGTSWNNAYLKLQDALLHSVYGDTIWVAQGTYYPTTSANRFFYFDLKNGVKLFGGFAGNETQLSQRDWNLYPSILSGDIGMSGDSTDNSFTVVNCGFVDSTTVFDGFVITGGNADSQSQFEPNNGKTKSGGGLYMANSNSMEESRLRIEKCVFIHNYAIASGGGIFCRSNSTGGSSLQVIGCSFQQNNASSGGGIALSGSSNVSSPKITDCSFIENNSNKGSGIYLANDFGNKDFQIINNDFNRNTSQVAGSGISIDNYNSNLKVIVSLCNFNNNVTLGEGAGIYCESLEPTSKLSIEKCNFELNECQNGVVSCYDGNLQIGNSNFVGNVGIFSGIELLYTIGDVHNCQFLDSKIISDVSSNSIIYIFGNGTGIKNNFINCTFSNNELNGKPIFYFQPSILTSNNVMANTIIYDNENVSQKPIQLSNSQMYITQTMIDVPDCASIANGDIICGPGMLYNLDPQFLDTAAGDYRLSPCSPARNAGSNAIVDSLGILTDIEGSPRIQGGTVDMGAYESPAFQATDVTVTSLPCGSGGLGTATLTLANGCPPYFLDWGGGNTISDSSLATLSLPVGTHSVTVTDGRMEGDTVSVTIGPAPAISGSASATGIDCGIGTGGTVSIEAVGGTGVLSYLWSSTGAGSIGTTATVSNLPAGTYQVTVSDENGCTFTDSVTVGLMGSLSLGINISPITCSGGLDGTAAVQPIGGTMPFTWLWQNGETSPMLDSLSGGAYSATVTDALGCTGDIEFTITPPPPVDVDIMVVQPPCFGELGIATASGTGGTGGFHFLWDNGATAASAMLAEGTHTVTVTDDLGCSAVDTALVQPPPQLQVALTAEPPVLCFGDSNGTIIVLPTGGSGQYGWGGPTENLTAGTYTVTVTDSNACTATATTNIAEHPQIMVTDTVTNASSATAADGSVVLTDVHGGSGSVYQFDWSNGSTSQDLVGVPTGDYSLTVTDPQGCTAAFGFSVDFNSAAVEARANPFGASIVPNPSGRAGAKVVLVKPLPGLTISVFDELGRPVIAEQTDQNGYKLPKGLAAGTYQVLLEKNKRRMVLTWVVGE